MRFLERYRTGDQMHFLQVHTNIRDFECEHCDKKFATRGQLKSHSNAVHDNPKGYTCEECGDVIYGRNKFSVHKNLHKTGARAVTHACNFCEKVFSKQTNRDTHEIQVHRVEEHNSVCQFCESRYGSVQVLNAHVRRVHKKVWVADSQSYTDAILCKVCGKAFSTLENLGKHTAEYHLGEMQI